MKFALTGGIASGKTVVAALLKERGFRILNADRLALEFIASSPAIRERITIEFGAGSFDAAGRLNRSWLAKRVFRDSDNLARYNAIYEPAWLSYLADTLATKEQRHGTIGLDAALIAEWRIAAWFDLVVLVTAPAPVRLARLQSTRHLTPAEAQRRLDAQLDDTARRTSLTVESTELMEINNDREIEDLREPVERVVQSITGAPADL